MRVKACQPWPYNSLPERPLRKRAIQGVHPHPVGVVPGKELIPPVTREHHGHMFAGQARHVPRWHGRRVTIGFAVVLHEFRQQFERLDVDDFFEMLSPNCCRGLARERAFIVLLFNETDIKSQDRTIENFRHVLHYQG